MSSDKVWKVSLIKKPIFRLDLSNINWNQFTEANGAGEWSNFFILDGVNKKPFNDFFLFKRSVIILMMNFVLPMILKISRI